MSPITRRDFVKAAGISASVAFLPASLRAQSAAGRVVVIGGGFGGGTTAKYLRMWSPDVRVTLVEPNPTYHSCVMSNLYYPGSIPLDFLQTSYDGLVRRGVDLVRDSVVAVDADTLTVTTPIGSFQGSVLNVIPVQRAGQVAFEAGLINVNGRWAGVDPQTFASTAAPDVFVVGDANGSSVGKSGHFANSEGKLVAAAIGAQLAGEPENPSPMLGNVCYSAITLSTASWFTNHLAYQGGVMVPVAESVAEGAPSGSNFERMPAWARNLWADSLH